MGLYIGENIVSGGGTSPFEAAQKAGYTGTEEEFNALLANIPTVTEQAAWDAKADPATTLAGYGIGDAYTKEEILSEETRTGYGIDENATPDEVFGSIGATLGLLQQLPVLQILYKGTYGGYGNLAAGYVQEGVRTVANTLFVIIWDQTGGQTTDRYIVLWRNQPIAFFYGVEEQSILGIETTWPTTDNGEGVVWMTAENSSLWQVSHFDMAQVEYPYICVGCSSIDIATSR